MPINERDFSTGQVIKKLNSLGGGGGGNYNFVVQDYDPRLYATSTLYPAAYNGHLMGAIFENSIFSIDGANAGYIQYGELNLPLVWLRFSGDNTIPLINISRTIGSNSFGIAMLKKGEYVENYLRNVLYRRNNLSGLPEYLSNELTGTGFFIAQEDGNLKVYSEFQALSEYSIYPPFTTTNAAIHLTKTTLLQMYFSVMGVSSEADLMAYMLQYMTPAEAEVQINDMRNTYVYNYTKNGNQDGVLNINYTDVDIYIYMLPPMVDGAFDTEAFDTTTQLQIHDLQREIIENSLPENIDDGTFLKVLAPAYLLNKTVAGGSYVIPYSNGADVIVIDKD